MEFSIDGSSKAQQRWGLDDIKVCIDARKLNDVIVKMPNCNMLGIREVIDNLGKVGFVTVLDMADSFQQFGIRKEDRVKLAFYWKGVSGCSQQYPMVSKS